MRSPGAVEVRRRGYQEVRVMPGRLRRPHRRWFSSAPRLLVLGLTLGLAFGLSPGAHRLSADVTATCGTPPNSRPTSLPFNDAAASGFFCQIAAAYLAGLANGTGPTTYNPGGMVPREQMAAFVTRTLDQSLRRGSRRAALDQWWTTRPLYD